MLGEIDVRVIMTASQYGAVGGIERYLWSVGASCGEHEVTVAAGRVTKSEYSVPLDNVRVYAARGRRPAALLSRTRLELHRRVIRRHGFDLHLHFGGPSMTDRFQARTRAIVPCGMDVTETARRFDHVLLEAPDNKHLVSDHPSVLVVPPPFVERDDNPAHVPAELRGRYFLTVFNPHSGAKGADIVERLAPQLPLPLIWCYGRQNDLRPDPRVVIPNVVPMANLTQPALRALYRSSAAYVSFSRTEGFGWSILDALASNTHVVSRRVGVLSYERVAELPGVHVYEAETEIARICRQIAEDSQVLDRADSARSAFAPERFWRTMSELADSGTGHLGSARSR